jgi:hypothetical protein
LFTCHLVELPIPSRSLMGSVLCVTMYCVISRTQRHPLSLLTFDPPQRCTSAEEDEAGDSGWLRHVGERARYADHCSRNVRSPHPIPMGIFSFLHVSFAPKRVVCGWVSRHSSIPCVCARLLGGQSPPHICLISPLRPDLMAWVVNFSQPNTHLMWHSPVLPSRPRTFVMMSQLHHTPPHTHTRTHTHAHARMHTDGHFRERT